MEAIGTLAGGVAHDFNNILMAFMGYANLLQLKLDPHDPLHRYVDQLLSCSSRGVALTQSLLMFSRKQVMELKPCEAGAVVRDVEKLLRRLLPEDIELEIKCGEEATVMADVAQMGQVLMNLATNARDAMPGGGRLLIETSREVMDTAFLQAHGYGEPGTYAVFSVTDTGTGMDKATQRRVFEPFFTTKEAGKGTGLGLSIIYGIIKEHRGYIAVSSVQGRGTTFRIYLPVASGGSAADRPAARAIVGGKETLLLVEDNADARGAVRDVLMARGYTVLEAADGREGVEKAAGHKDRIDLVILDVVMPRMNGRETFKEIRKLRPDVRVLFMSGYARDMILDKGVYDYLSKPVTPEDLLARVREVIDR
jgi:CheY-like chemotaxis protein